MQTRTDIGRIYRSTVSPVTRPWPHVGVAPRPGADPGGPAPPSRRAGRGRLRGGGRAGCGGAPAAPGARLPVVLLEIPLKVPAREPHLAIRVPAVQALLPTPPLPDLDARDRGGDGGGGDLLDPLRAAPARDLDEPKRPRPVHPGRDQVERVEDVRRLADPERLPWRTDPLRAPDGGMDDVAVHLEELPGHHLEPIPL